MVRVQSGPSLKKLLILTVVVVAIVLLLRNMSATPLELMSKQSSNRVYYEQMYAEVSDEVADWRRRYDNEIARAEEHLKLLTESQSQAKRFQEENENLKAELLRLREQGKAGNVF